MYVYLYAYASGSNGDGHYFGKKIIILVWAKCMQQLSNLLQF